MKKDHTILKIDLCIGLTDGNFNNKKLSDDKLSASKSILKCRTVKLDSNGLSCFNLLFKFNNITGALNIEQLKSHMLGIIKKDSNYLMVSDDVSNPKFILVLLTSSKKIMLQDIAPFVCNDVIPELTVFPSLFLGLEGVMDICVKESIAIPEIKKAIDLKILITNIPIKKLQLWYSFNSV